MKWLLALLLAGCTAATSGGSTSPESIPDVPPAPNGVAVSINVFGATFCGPCKTQIPKVQSELDALAKSKRGQIEFRLYVTDVSTDAEAKNYATGLLHIAPDKAIADRNAKVMRQMNIGNSIPAGIVLDKDGKVLKRFPAGGMSFVPSEIVKFAESQTK